MSKIFRIFVSEPNRKVMKAFESIGHVEEHAKELMNKRFKVNLKHRLTCSGIGYDFVWANTVRLFGQCRSKEKIIRLSKPLVKYNLKCGEQIHDVILHEIAHAFDFRVFKGRRQSAHGKTWKSVARDIGAEPRACYSPSDLDKLPETKYITLCPVCGQIDDGPYYRKPNESWQWHIHDGKNIPLDIIKVE